MKNTITLFLLAFFVSFSIYSQNSEINYKKDDVFIIANVKNNNYEYINFPRANFIIKKGGIANFKNIQGEKITRVSNNYIHKEQKTNMNWKSERERVNKEPRR
jgi:hypothetical protein